MHPKFRNLASVSFAISLGLSVIGVAANARDSDAVKATNSVAVAYRRMTENQYRHAIADAFGPDIEINARFEPELREAGLQAVGNARLSITTSGLEQYLSLARSISDQVVDAENAATRLGCSLETTSTDCARKYMESLGSDLFRRPLTDDEVADFLASYNQGVDGTGKAAKGFKLALIGMLMSPEFLFRVERAEVDPQDANKHRLNAYTKAARISYLLWDAAPDAELLETARSGDIHKAAVVAAQVDRLLTSPRVEDGVRAFFTDMLQFETFETLSKDGATYPKFSQAVADSAREETLKFLVDQLVTQGGDYRDIFTSQETFINRNLAAVYDVPYLSKEPWVRHEFSEDNERSGVLTQVTFLSLFSHPGASSPTVRGVKLYDIFLCIALPQPPPDVDFSKVQAVENGTVRSRLIEHKTNPGCYSCHNISDPPGLALEHFDGLGQHRVLENGDLIDVSAEIDGKTFDGSQGLGKFMRNNPLVPQCLVRNVHNYGVGRVNGNQDRDILARQRSNFADNGYRLQALLRGVLTDPDFFKVDSQTTKSLANETSDRVNASATSNTGVAQ